MPKRVRVSILVGQIALLGLGLFLLVVFFDALRTMQTMGFWYTGPPPVLFIISGIACIIGAVLLFSVVTFEVKEDKMRTSALKEKLLLIARYKEKARTSSLILLGLAVLGLLLSYISIIPIYIPAKSVDILATEEDRSLPQPYYLPPNYWDTMRTDLSFLLTLPPGYWFGVVIIVVSILLMISLLENRTSRITFVLSAALLMISIRMLFPAVSATPYLYEPDSVLYMRIVEKWLKSGFTIGVIGNYQHDFPMAFLIAYAFTRLGISLDTFFRWFPSIMYVIDVALVYFISNLVYPQSKRACAIAALLFSLSPFTYWVNIHFCPELVGTTFFLLSLYLSIRLAKQTSWKIKDVIPILVVIPLLILSHHLSTLYLIVTLLGLAFFARILKGNSITFLLLGVYTYTFWFAYGTVVYPGFFNLYTWFGFSWTLPQSQVGRMDLFDFVLLSLYPLTIALLFISRFFAEIKTTGFSKLKRWLNPLKIKDTLNATISANAGKMHYIYVTGFAFIGLLILAGFVFQALMPVRVFEVFLLSLYPLSSLMFVKFFGGTSKKKKALLMSLLILLVITSILRFDRTVQRRIQDWIELLKQYFPQA